MNSKNRFRRTPGQLLLIVILLAAPITAFAENHTITIGRQGFQPNEITINTGDTIIWTVEEGTHIVASKDGSFHSSVIAGSGRPDNTVSFSHTFNQPGEFPYTCSLHRTRYETAHVQPLVTVVGEPVASGMDINFGHGGSWYNTDENGQGFSLEVVPDSAALIPGSGQLVAYWFTFARGTPGGPASLRWYEGLGPIDGPDAMLDVYQVSGGVFDDPAETAIKQIGSALVHFDRCTEGSISYSLELDGDGSEESTGDITLTRITPDVLCTDLSAN